MDAPWGDCRQASRQPRLLSTPCQHVSCCSTTHSTSSRTHLSTYRPIRRGSAELCLPDLTGDL